jgi:S-adenosylmethionine:tRNA ribosyltransferase-isomerase
MPSAGRGLRVETLAALRRRGVEVASVTHAAGLSATGDPAIDARLPLPERFEVGHATARAVARTRARGGRVIAVGTSVVRALESAARLSTAPPLIASSGVTDLVLCAATPLQVVDAIVTGVHDAETSHFMLLGAFARRSVLEGALRTASALGFLGHELGDAWLLWRDAALAHGYGPSPCRSTSDAAPNTARMTSATFAA